MRVKTLLLPGAASLALASLLAAQNAPTPGSIGGAAPAATSAQTPAPQPPDSGGRHPVDNSDVIAMVQNHVSDDAIVGMIGLNDVQFDTSVVGLVTLKKSGVSDRVIEAILEAARRNRSPPAAAESTATPEGGEPHAAVASMAAAPPAGSAAGTQSQLAPQTAAPALPSGLGGSDARSAALQSAATRLQAMGYGASGGLPMGVAVANGTPVAPRVFLLVDSVRNELTASTAQRAVLSFRGGTPNTGAMAMTSLASQALAFASIAGGPATMAAGMAARTGLTMFRSASAHSSSPKMTFAWGLPGVHSERALATPQPSFELLYKDIPGIDPEAFEPALVRLAITRDNYRLVGATQQEMRMAMGISNGAPANWVTEERVPAHLQKREPGAYALLADKALPAGEYAVVLRPVKHYDAQPSGFGNTDQLTATVWDFSLPAAPQTGLR